MRVERSQSSSKPVPTLSVHLDQNLLRYSGYQLANMLLEGDPPIAVGESYADLNIIVINPQGLTEDEASILGVRLQTLLLALR